MTERPSARTVHAEPVMGTVVSIDIRGAAPALAHDAIAEACAWLHRVDAMFSTYKPSSEISRIARGELAPEQASADVQFVLRRCEQLRAETGGPFDAYATGQLDPSAFVKGWAVQRASELLLQRGLHDHCIGAGGDLVCRALGAWRVGIQHPLDPAAIAEIVELSGGAVATSGAYERGEHIVAPATGAAPTGVLSVTVTGPDLGIADAYSTAAFAMGDDGPPWTLGLPGYEALTIMADGRVLRTPNFPLATGGAERAVAPALAHGRAA